VGLYTKLFYAIIPTLFLCFFPIYYPYILLHFECFLFLYCTYATMNLTINELVYTVLSKQLSRETSKSTHLNSKRLQDQQQRVVKRLLFHSQIAPEASSEGQKSEHLLGEHAPRPPTTAALRALLCFLWITLEPPISNPRSATAYVAGSWLHHETTG